MTIRWTGPFASSDIPAGQRITGWSEYTTGVDALKARYRDGDPVATVLWREMYGNVNVYYNGTRQRLWTDVFITTSAGDPTKSNTGYSWNDPVCLYAITPRIILHPNAYRGAARAPQLSVKVRARKDGAANVAAATVRVYTVDLLSNAVQNWEAWGITQVDSYAAFQVSSTSYPTAATGGWSSSAAIQNPTFFQEEISYQDPNDNSIITENVYTTHFLIAGIGNNFGDGVFVAAIQIWEEEPGDG